MRIVVDLQGLQSTASADRGVGRYTESIVEALLRESREHEVVLALNGAFPRSFDRIKAKFSQWIEPCDFAVWQHFYDTAAKSNNAPALLSIAQKTRERFMQTLAPDVIFSTNLQEGLIDAAVTGVKSIECDAVYCSTLHDVVPLSFDGYLEDGTTRQWYWEKLAAAIASDVVITVSEASRREILKRLPIPESRLFALPNGYDRRLFRRLDASSDSAGVLASYGVRAPYLLYVGGADLHKNLSALLTAFSLLPLATQTSHQLVLAGGVSANDERLSAIVADLGIGDRVVFAGRVDDKHLPLLYANCAVFVFPSLFEGFGLPVIEALACGAPVLASNTPTGREILPIADALFDPHDAGELASKVQRCLAQPAFKQSIIDAADQILPRFSWENSARKLLDLFEEQVSSRRSARGSARISTTLQQARELVVEDARPLMSGLTPHARSLVAKSISETFDRTGRPTLLIDISTVVHQDHRTGIQRVVRAISAELLNRRSESRDVRLVYGGDGHGFTAANAYAWSTFKVLGPSTDATVDVYPGDIVLFLDLNPGVAIQHRDHVRYLRNRGVSVYHVVYDILPLETPETFWPELCAEFRLWAEVVASSDGAICISKTVAKKFAEFAAIYGESRPMPFDVGYFHLGADLHRSAPSRGLPEDADEVLSLLHARPTFLMVGTVEPRKAHRQTVRAFELLWDAGVDVNLVIVGKMGWGMGSFDDELLHHPRVGEKLLWLQGISDEFLERIYASSKALIAASEGEGFGLPLIEAAQHGLKLVIRDIPVFREVAGENAHYFADARDPRVITRSIEEWLRLDASGQAPKSSAIQFLNWEQSAGQLMDVIEGRSARLTVRAHGNLCPGTSYGVSDGKLSWTGFSAPRAGVRWVGTGTSRVTFKWQEQTGFGLMQLNCPPSGAVSLQFKLNGEAIPGSSIDAGDGLLFLAVSGLLHGTNVLSVDAALTSAAASDTPRAADVWGLSSLALHSLPAIPWSARVPHTSIAVLWQGFSGAEQQMRWSNGRMASITFFAAEARSACQMLITLKTFGKQRVDGSFNGDRVFDDVLDTQKTTVRIHLANVRMGFNRLVFQLPNARMPERNDDRHLAIGVFELRLEAGASSQGDVASTSRTERLRKAGT